MHSGLSIISEPFGRTPRRSIDICNLSPGLHQFQRSNSLMMMSAAASQQSAPCLPSTTAPPVAPPSLPFPNPPQSNQSLTPPGSSGHKLSFEFNLEDHIKKTRQAGKYLKQINHSKYCSDPRCAYRLCLKTKEILKHVYICTNTTQNCPIPGCQTTKSLLHHSETSANSWYKLKGTETTAQKDFCLICTIALIGNDEATKGPTSMISKDYEKNYFTQDDAANNMFPFIISDEIIEFSRIPFQQDQLYHSQHGYHLFSSPPNSTNDILQETAAATQAAHANISYLRKHAAGEFSPSRNKTYSDSNFVVSTGELSPSSTAAMAAAASSKKQRSKSWNTISYHSDQSNSINVAESLYLNNDGSNRPQQHYCLEQQQSPALDALNVSFTDSDMNNDRLVNDIHDMSMEIERDA
jgi:hypothetical protein